MAYVIKKRESYRWTVEHVIEVRQGKPEVMVFDAEFKVVGLKRVDELLARARALEIKDDEFIDLILVEFHDLEGEGGKVYRKADLAELCDMYPGILASLSKAWTQSVLGGGAARKN